MNKRLILIAIIFVFAAILRFYQLGDALSLHRDEAFLGYNAYSILKTGKDMSGVFFPLHLESFIYSPAGYSYFSIPFIILFDLNEFSVRFASALFGSLTVLLMYFLVKTIFGLSQSTTSEESRSLPRHLGGDRTDSSEVKRLNSVALFSAFLLAISPWHINLSRTATENVLVLFFLLLGILFFLKYLKESYLYLVLSFLCFGITFLLYQAPRAFLPIFIPFLVLALVQRKKILKDKFALGFIYLVTIILPIVFILNSADLSLRIRSLSIFQNDQTNIVLTEQIANDGESGLPYLATRIFHNKVVGYSLLFGENYLKHFNFDFLFLDNGFPQRYKVPMVGLLYIFELPLIFLGLFYTFQKNRRTGIFLLGWILIAPIGSALTFDDVPNMQRTLIGLPAYTFLSAQGLIGIFEFLRRINKYVYRTAVPAVSLVVIFSLSYYLVQYYTQAIRYKTWYRQDGYKDLVYRVNNFLPKHKKAIITNRESAPTIFFLFYNKYSPKSFQKEIGENTHRSFDRMNFGQYIFTEEECPLRNITDKEKVKSTGEKDTLYVNSALCKEDPPGSKILSEIKRRDGSLVFKVLEYSEQQ